MNAAFFKGNRQALRAVCETNPIVMTAYSAMQKSNDGSYALEQEANFWYLTGIESADWLLVIEGNKSTLIAPDIDEIHAVFDGSLSWETAKQISGVDDVVSKKDGEALIYSLALKYDNVSTVGKDHRSKYYDFILNPAPEKLVRRLKKQFKAVEDCRRQLAKLRAIKQPVEIASIRQAIDLTIAGFEEVKERLSEYSHEYEVESAFSHYFRSRGANGHAYDPIVAVGKNACTLHYVANNDPLHPNELLLLDIGARVDGYAADITRTFAIGTPTQRQKDVQSAVETAHARIIDLLHPDLSIEDYGKSVDIIMKEALDGLGLLKNDGDYRKYFPHAVSHGLGIDVHDSLGGPDVFLPGMVLTVEPGIYIPEEGIGVRIEDDILITKDGNENLSAALPTSL